MRKHFLILMLFALLPLAGWAAVENVGFAVTIGATDVPLNPAAINQANADDENDPNSVYLIYNAQEKALPTPTSIGNQNISQYVINSTWYKATKSGDTYVKSGEAIEKIKDAGFYLCEFTVNQGNLQGGHTGVLEIVKRELTVKASDMVNDADPNEPQNAIAYGSTFDATPVKITWGNWPATLTEEDQAALKTSFGTVNIISDYVPFTTPVTNVAVQDPAYNKVIPVVEYLVSSNYNFKAVNGKLQVVAKNMADGEFTVTTNNRFYNGQGEAPVLVVKDNANPDKALVLNQDYELTYYSASSATQALAGAPTHVGNYWFKISGKNGSNYTGQYASVYTYKVRPQRLEISLKNPAVPYKAAAYNLATATAEATSALYDIEGLATGDGVSAITVVLQDGTEAKPAELKDLTYTTGQAPNVETHYTQEVTNVAFNADGYKLKKITPTFSGIAANNAEDYDVVIMTPNFKIKQAPIEITFKSFSLHEDESAEIKEGIAITTGQNSNVATYLTLSNPNVLAPNVITAYPKVVATESNGVWTISFAKDAKGNQLNPTVKASGDANADEVTRNYAFELTEGTLTIIADLGILYVTPQADTYGALTKKGFIKVKVVGGEAADNAKLEALLNNDMVTVKPYLNEQDANDQNNGKLLDVTAHFEYPHAGTYNVAYDESIYESADWIALKENYDINLTGRPTYTIKPAPLKIKLNNQSLNDGDGIGALKANKYTVEFVGLVNGDAEKDFYADVKNAFVLNGTVATGQNANTEKYFENNVLTAAAIAYDDEKVNATDEETTLGYFANAIKLDGFAPENYTVTVEQLGGLFVSAKNVEFTLNLNPVTKAAWDELTDVQKTNNTTNITANKNHKVKTVKFDDFELKAEKWYPMVLPFNTTVAELSQKFGYAIVNILNTENTDDNIRFKLHMQDIKANQPFLIKIVEDKVMNDNTATPAVEFANVTILDSDYNADVNENTGIQFIGFYDAKIGVTDHDFWYHPAGGYDARYGGKADPNRYLRPLNAFVQTPASSAARVIYVEDPVQGVTAIESISAEGAEAIPVQGWYTINGIKLEGVPTEKGIYINNGKKVVIK